MERILEQPHSVWHAEAIGWHSPLAESEITTVCIIGAGISGLALAFELVRRNVAVIILDARTIAHGQTSRSTAHLVTALDERYFKLAQEHGPDAARVAAWAHKRAIEWLESVAREEGIDAAFRRVFGALVVPDSQRSERNRLLQQELEAAQAAGIACDLVPAPAQTVIGHGESHLRFPHQAVCDPVAYLDGLAEAVVRRGGRVCTQTAVVDVTATNLVRTASGHTVQADHVIYACHQLPSEVQRLVRPLTVSTSYAVAYRLASDDSAGSVEHEPGAAGVHEPETLLWDGYWEDESAPYHYLRTARSADGEPMLVIGGDDRESHSPGDAPAHFDKVDGWTRMHVPHAGATLARWWGRIYEPEGEFALIGPIPERNRQYVIAGDSGNGFTYAAIAAEHLADLITGLDADIEIAALHRPAPTAGPPGVPTHSSDAPFQGQALLLP